jgi:hypothetical protein
LSQAQLQKTYQCLTCKADIKLARKDDNSGWDKFNLDGTPHTHQKQQQKQPGPSSTPQPQASQPQATSISEGAPPPQLAALAEEVGELKAEVKILIAQIQMLRSDVVKTWMGAKK